MIQVKKNDQKRAIVCKIDSVLTSEVSVRNYPGNEIFIAGEWQPVRFSSADFQETDETNGEPVRQELTILISGSEKETEQTIRELCGQELLIRLQYSNGETKVIGTDDNPVSLSHGSAGAPVVQTLYCKRNSAEKAKHLQE
jgi:hypothetical protein